MRQRSIAGYQAQTRSKVISYTVCLSILFLLLSVLQITVFAEHSLFGSTPDLILCAVLCVGFFMGRHAGAVTGIGAGLLIEALGSTGILLLPVAYLFLGYLAGYYARVLAAKQFTSYLVFLAFALLLRGAVTLTYICLTYSSFHLLHVFVYTLLPEAADTALAGMILYFPIRCLAARLNKKR
ncbi:MAG: rod shape-determining protein MreD [Clostridia bacterium]|nr:rod shape-determining protein MreD [Clostridia bacterium]